ncbi:MAG TPA: hypothetical protein DIT39_06905 [Tissierellales bacterium]|nr:hypothetical protein [Tissierellales bacterium]
MRMKICMLSTDFLPGIGGIAAHVYELSKALVKQDNEVHVIAPRRHYYDKTYEEIDGIKVHRLYFPRRRIIGFIIYFFPASLKLRRLIRNEGVNIVHSHTSFYDALLARFGPNIPKIETEHSSGFLIAVEEGKHIRRHRWLLGHADHVIGPSQELVDTVVKVGISRNMTSFVSNGVDIEKFNPEVEGMGIRAKYIIRPEEKVILCPRRLELKNGVEYLIEAMPYIINTNSDARCLIVGDGSERETLKKEVVRLSIADKVIFAGAVANVEMPGYYAASDIVVLPSLKEATSIAGLEAMASGKPLVGTNVGGIPQIIADGETGILVSSRNPEELANAIATLLSDDGKRATMGLSARRRAESEFSWETIAQKTMSIYSSIMR